MDIHAPEGDPRKVYTGDQVYAAVQRGDINVTDANRLLGDVANQKDANNAKFGARMQQRMSIINSSLRASPEYSAQPELSAAISLEVAARAEQKAAEMRTAGKDPSGLLNPDSPDYFFKPQLIADTAAEVKRQTRDQAMANVHRPQTDEDYMKIPVGEAYMGKDGQVYVKKAAPAKTETAADKAERERQQWMAETGGTTRPGESTEQAFTRWKASK
jgi:polyhydroxyalkanoate synthesis regulator phasin